MEYKETYEKSWEISKRGKFTDYERNLLLPEFFRGGKILDVAGGPGIVGEWFKNKGYEVTPN